MNLTIFWLIASLVSLDFFGYGLALGFVAAMGVVVLLALAGWLFYRHVSRPRVAFQIERIGNRYYRMEVA